MKSLDLSDRYNLDYFANIPKRNIQVKTYYNPNSNHSLGKHAFDSLTDATNRIKKIFPQYSNVEFIPGGGSLANERAILDQWKIKNHVIPSDRNVIMMSSIEHSSISKYVMQLLNDRGYIIIVIPVTSFGIINMTEFSKMVESYKNKIALITCMLVNNETGVIQPLNDMISLVTLKSPDIIFHSDISCCVGLFCEYLKDDNVQPDVVTFSAYKFGGPHYGVLISKESLRKKTMPTPDVQSICNTVDCLEEYLQEYPQEKENNITFKRIFQKTLFDNFRLHNINFVELDTPMTIETVIPFIISDLKSSVIQKKLDNNNIFIGSGSACSTNEGSNTLKSMGYDSDISQKLIRLSYTASNLGKNMIKTDTDYEKNIISFALRVSDKIIEAIDENIVLIKESRQVTQIIKESKIIMPSAREDTKFPGNLDTPLTDVFIDTIALTFGELSLKGANQSSFVDRLKMEIISKLIGVNYGLKRSKGMIYIKLNEPIKMDSIILTKLLRKLYLIAGVSYIIPMTQIKADTAEEICYKLASIYNHKRESSDEKTFRIRAVMSTKYLEKSSKDWEYYVGRYIKDRFNDVVMLKEDKCKITLNIFYDGQTFFAYTDKISGLSGLPSGSEGNVMFFVTRCNYMRSLVSIFSMVKRGIVPYVILDNKCKELYDSLNDFTQTLTKMSKIFLIDTSDQYFLDNFKTHKVKHLVIETGYIQKQQSNGISVCSSTDLHFLKTLSKKINVNVFSVTSLMTHDEILIFVNNMTNEWELNIVELNDDTSLIHSIFDKHLITDGFPYIAPTMNNKGLVLISGGIDSPVVSAKLLSNNMVHEYVHFIADIDDTVSKTKIINIIKQLNSKSTGISSVVHFVNFGKLQKMLTDLYREDYRVMLYKIYMVIISNQIAYERGCDYIAMGNSWGQVASQTPQNLFVTNLFSGLPILSPLIAQNKNEIIKDADKSKTYDLSICNGNDCCTLYLPKNPVLSASSQYIDSVIREVNHMDYIDITQMTIH